MFSVKLNINEIAHRAIPFFFEHLQDNRTAVPFTCSPETQQKIALLNIAIKNMVKEIPTKLSGAQVPSGSCTLRALVLGVSEGGLKRDFSNVVNVQNAIDCIALEKYYTVKDCECGAKSSSYSRDEALQDSSFLVYRKIKTQRNKLRSLGISNPVISEYVKRAQSATDCITEASIEQLQLLLVELEKLENP